MDKISMSQVAEVMANVGPTLRKLASERDEAIAKLAAYERKVEVEKVASAMINKGLTTDPFDRVVDQLEKAAEQGQLETIRSAVELSGPDMGEKVARIASDERYDLGTTGAETDFVRFIVGDVG